MACVRGHRRTCVRVQLRACGAAACGSSQCPWVQRPNGAPRTQLSVRARVTTKPPPASNDVWRPRSLLAHAQACRCARPACTASWKAPKQEPDHHTKKNSAALFLLLRARFAPRPRAGQSPARGTRLVRQRRGARRVRGGSRKPHDDPRQQRGRGCPRRDKKPQAGAPRQPARVPRRGATAVRCTPTRSGCGLRGLRSAGAAAHTCTCRRLNVHARARRSTATLGRCAAARSALRPRLAAVAGGARLVGDCAGASICGVLMPPCCAVPPSALADGAPGRARARAPCACARGRSSGCACTSPAPRSAAALVSRAALSHPLSAAPVAPGCG